MKRNILLLFAAVTSAVTAFAQVENENSRWSNIDWKEDSTEIVTIDDIIKEQQDVTSRNTREMHFADVWGRRSYFNIAYNKGVWLTAKEQNTVKTGYPDIAGGYFNKELATWSFALQKGRNYVLHKKPIANTVQICIDYTGLDLTASHYPGAAGKTLYDSSTSKKFSETDKNGHAKTYFYIPWNLEKYEASYGMSLGPSLTIAPFNYINFDGIHYMKFNIYYHWGYQASVLYMLNNKDADANTSSSDMDENLKLLWGHGMYTAFGMNLSWKILGVGFETRTSATTYQPLNTSDFFTTKSGFTSKYTRFYIQFRM